MIFVECVTDFTGRVVQTLKNSDSLVTGACLTSCHSGHHRVSRNNPRVLVLSTGASDFGRVCKITKADADHTHTMAQGQ